MERKYDKKLVLGDGTVFEGYGFGADRRRCASWSSIPLPSAIRK